MVWPVRSFDLNFVAAALTGPLGRPGNFRRYDLPMTWRPKKRSDQLAELAGFGFERDEIGKIDREISLHRFHAGDADKD